MATASVVEMYPKGTLIVHQDSYGDCMYHVLSGKIRIFRTREGTETTLGVVGPGEVFGEMAVFEHAPRSASAQVIEDTDVRVITRAEFEAMECDPVIRMVLNNMAHRLHDVDESYERLAVDAVHRREFMSNLSARRDWAAM